MWKLLVDCLKAHTREKSGKVISIDLSSDRSWLADSERDFKVRKLELAAYAPEGKNELYFRGIGLVDLNGPYPGLASIIETLESSLNKIVAKHKVKDTMLRVRATYWVLGGGRSSSAKVNIVHRVCAFFWKVITKVLVPALY